jgi:hypothetical protein
MVTPAGKFKAVVHLCEALGVGQQWVCDVLQFD